MKYVVVHANKSMQMAAGGAVVPAGEVAEFKDALECAQSLSALLASERKRIDEAVAQAKAQGYEQGLVQARAEVEADFSDAVARCAADFELHQQASRQAVATLAMAVVRKVAPALGVESLVPGLVQHAVASLAGEHAIQIRVHPAALPSARQRLDELEVEIALMADESLERFDCVIDTTHGQLVAGLEDQLEIVERALVEPVAILEAA